MIYDDDAGDGNLVGQGGAGKSGGAGQVKADPFWWFVALCESGSKDVQCTMYILDESVEVVQKIGNTDDFGGMFYWRHSRQRM